MPSMRMGCSPLRGLFNDARARLTHVAAQQRRGHDEFVQDMVTRYPEDEVRFLEGVERGIQAAERGEFIEEEEMDARVEGMFKS
jgi:predicted transcriptional regulator